jgi:hypothetical protein
VCAWFIELRKINNNPTKKKNNDSNAKKNTTATTSGGIPDNKISQTILQLLAVQDMKLKQLRTKVFRYIGIEIEINEFKNIVSKVRIIFLFCFY